MFERIRGLARPIVIIGAIAGAPLSALLNAAANESQDESDNRLRNGDFESGGSTAPSDWSTIYPPALGTPTFSVDSESPHAGKRAGRIDVTFSGGYSSFTQSISLRKTDRSVRFETYARIDDPRQGAANILLWFTIPDHADGGEVVQSKRLSTEREWTKLVLEAAIPQGATELIARCGVYGPCAASFDDAALFVSDRETTPVRLVVGHGDYVVTAKGAKASVLVSIPFPLGGQTPLAIKVTSQPDGVVRSIGIVEDKENRPAKLVLGGLKAGASATLRIETLTLLRDRPLATGEGIALTAKAKVPKNVKPFLEKAPGIDVDAPAVRELAARVDRKDFASAMSSVAKLLREKLTYDGGTSQGAIECLDSGKAVCTGYANVGASLLIAAGVPTRILACTTIGSRLQEHYIVEAWTEKLQWSRMESTAARFPWRDSENLVLRIVYSDSERSPFDVPLFKQASSDAEVNFHMGNDTCWQGAEELETFALDAAVVTAIEGLARARFAALTKQPGSGEVVALLESDATLPAPAARVLETVGRWVTKP